MVTECGRPYGRASAQCRRYGRHSRFAGWLCSRLRTEQSVRRSALWLTLLGSFASLFAASQPWSLGCLRLRSAQLRGLPGARAWAGCWGRSGSWPRCGCRKGSRPPERKGPWSECYCGAYTRLVRGDCATRRGGTMEPSSGHLPTWPNNGERIGLMPRAPRYRQCGPAPPLSALACAKPDATARDHRVFRHVRPYRSRLGGPATAMRVVPPGALPVFPIGM